MREVVDRDESRQGGPGRPVFYVLMASLVLIAVGFAIMAVYGFGVGGGGDAQFSDERPEVVVDGTTTGAPSDGSVVGTNQ